MQSPRKAEELARAIELHDCQHAPQLWNHAPAAPGAARRSRPAAQRSPSQAPGGREASKWGLAAVASKEGFLAIANGRSPTPASLLLRVRRHCMWLSSSSCLLPNCKAESGEQKGTNCGGIDARGYVTFVLPLGRFRAS